MMTCWLAAVALLFQACTTTYAQPSPYTYARCGPGDDPNVIVEGQINVISRGDIDLRQEVNGPVEFKIDMFGFNPKDKFKVHGMAIHQYGDISGFTCANAGPHFNPLKVHHGGPDDNMFNKHFGDLGNFEEDENGEIHARFFNNLVSLHGKYSIMGKLLTLSLLPDDLGKGGNEGSKMNGNTGPITTCCIIGPADGSNFKD